MFSRLGRREEHPGRQNAEIKDVGKCGRMVPRVFKLSRPMIAETPAKPTMMPTSRPPVIFLSLVNACATMTVQIGVVALKIDAIPLAMWVCPQTIKQKGVMLLSKPKPKNAPHSRRYVGIRKPVARTTMLSTIAV